MRVLILHGGPFELIMSEPVFEREYPWLDGVDGLNYYHTEQQIDQNHSSQY
jgi:hypothetical protein